MPSTFVHGILPSSCSFVAKKSLPTLDRAQMLKLLFIAFILGNACDIDIIPAMLLPDRWTDIHRYWGHNIFCISLYILAGRWALTRFVHPSFKEKVGWLLTVSLVLSHVFLDAAGDFNFGSDERIGVPLFWPISDWEFLLPFALFKSYQLSEASTNPLVSHILSVDFWTRAVFTEIGSSVMLLLIWSGLYGAYRRWIASKPSQAAMPTETASEIDSP